MWALLVFALQKHDGGSLPYWNMAVWSLLYLNQSEDLCLTGERHYIDFCLILTLYGFLALLQSISQCWY